MLKSPTFISILALVLIWAIYSQSNDEEISPVQSTHPISASSQKSVKAVTKTLTETSEKTEEFQGLEIPKPLTDRNEIVLRHLGYTVSYNKGLGNPNWVAWHLTADKVNGTAERKGIKFQEDPDISEPRVSTKDYVHSGYDRGHMCPAGDNKWSREAMVQSFYMTNVCPQNHNLNRGDWNEMEQQCRKWATKYGDVYIVAGPIFYKKQNERIGDYGVAVPNAFFKVVLCMKGTPKAIGFLYKNGEGNRPKGDYVNSVDQVERITGIDFFPSLPDAIENKVEAECNYADW